MPFKIVGADENGLFPTRVMTALRNLFAQRSADLSNQKIAKVTKTQYANLTRDPNTLYVVSDWTRYNQFRWTITNIADVRDGVSPTSASGMQAADLNFYDAADAFITPQSAQLTAGNPPTVTTESVDSLLDNTASTKWFTTTQTGAQVIIKFASFVKPVRYSWVTGNDAPGRDPVSWTLEGGDGSGTWTTLDTKTLYATPTGRNVSAGSFPITTF